MMPKLAIHSILLHAALVSAKINWDAFHHPIVKGFDWARPFSDDWTVPLGFESNCEATVTFHAKQYKFEDLQTPSLGLGPLKKDIDFFFGLRTYPGSWDGVDIGDSRRDMIIMEYKDVPTAVKDWIEQQRIDSMHPNRWLFGVYEKPRNITEEEAKETPVRVRAAQATDEDKILLFAPGALYTTMPLWVAAESACHVAMEDLSRYKHKAEDNGVIAWPIDRTHLEEGSRNKNITFTIKAMLVHETEHGRNQRLMWERLHRSLRRQERKELRKEREQAKKELTGETRVKDEL